MNLVRRAAQQVGAGLSLSDFDRVLDAMYGGQPSWTGKLVSQQSSLAVSTVWACVDALSSDIATLPFLTYRYLNEGREPAPDHYLWSLLLEEANPELTSFRFKQLMQTWLGLWGNAYSEIQISGRGQVIGLWPWRPDRTTVSRAGGATGPLQYSYRLKDNTIIGPIPQDRMLHLRGMGTDGVMGLSPIEVHRQTVGMAEAIKEHAARFFGNSAIPKGVLTTPNKLSVKALESLKESWAARHEGLTNSYRTAILEEGLTYKETQLNMVDMEYIKAAGLSAEDIARIFKMPQHRIGLLDRSTNSNIEHQGLEYVQYTLGPIATNWHQEIERSLLSTRERQEITVRPNFRSLLRGDHAAMAVFISQLVDRGILNADEVREEFLDMNPQAGGVGRDYFKAVNMAPVNDNFGQNPQQVQKVVPKNKPDNKAQVNGLPH